MTACGPCKALDGRPTDVGEHPALERREDMEQIDAILSGTPLTAVPYCFQCHSCKSCLWKGATSPDGDDTWTLVR
jgi:hypothetical protein